MEKAELKSEDMLDILFPSKELTLRVKRTIKYPRNYQIPEHLDPDYPVRYISPITIREYLEGGQCRKVILEFTNGSEFIYELKDE